MVPTGHRPPPPPGTARVAITGTIQGHRWTQVFYLQLTAGTVTVDDLKTIADGIEGLYSSWIGGLWPTTVSLLNITIVYIPSAGTEVVYEGVYSLAGHNGATQIDSAAVCVVVQWKISAYYRGGHPRSYFPGPTTADVSNGSDLTSTAQTNWATNANHVRNGINALTSTNISAVVMGTVSFQTGNAWRTTPVFRPYTSVAVNPKLGTQRRRILS